MVVKNKYGYYELAQKPESDEVLREYYEQKYYQTNKGAYQNAYSEKELTHLKNSIRQKHYVIEQLKKTKHGNLSILDTGCGEGWVLQHFYDLGWNVTGMDFSSFGIESLNPSMAKFLIQGDICTNIQKLKGQKFDVIWMDNLLEHVLDPLLLLKYLKQLMNEGGVLMVNVPNDFSILQEKLMAEKHIDRQFWVVTPDHISYFNREGLNALCADAGWKNSFTMADFPIDFNLFNPDTNYVMDKSKGRNVHLSRVELDNLFCEISISQTVELYAKLSEMGLGRQITGFFTLAG